ncbi:MAG TPA: helix-turn-helix domain-containing protein [Candidatus Dormibacteraeota bacterium]|nr:helix-turn-helix domain-containing protein [Candidatus Dormibacteraeota bacterium]
MLEAARSVFSGSGYAGATIEAVALAAGVSVPTVYAVFGSKPGLLSALVADAGSDPGIRRLAARAMSERDPHRRLAAVAKVVRTIMQAEGILLRFLTEAGTGRPELEAARRQVHLQQRQALTGALRLLTETKSLRAGITFDEAVATFCDLASPESYSLLVDEFGWSAARWERWLSDTAVRLFID